MPDTAARRSRRRTVNEINMVPFIDVMLVLLIIFMVTAPMLTPGAINVPSAGRAQRPPTQHVAHVLIAADGSLALQLPAAQPRSVSAAELGPLTAQWQSAQPPGSAVLIQADKTLAYERVVDTLSQLQAAGVQRVALGVRSTSSASAAPITTPPARGAK